MTRMLPFVLVLVALMFPVWADTIIMKNGDRLTGTVQHSDSKDTITIITPYAGEITVDRNAISQIETQTEENAATEVKVAPKPVEKKKEKKKWSGKAISSMSMRSGETESLDAEIGIELKRKWDGDTLTISGTGQYGSVDSEINIRSVEALARLQHYLGDKLYFYGHAGSEHDAGRRLQLRMEGGLGVGYDLIKSDKRKLTLDTGMDYAHELWNKYSITELQDLRDESDDDIDQETQTKEHIYVHLEARYEQKIFGESKIAENILVLPSIDQLGEYRLTSNLVFTSPLTKQLSLRIALKTIYETSVEDSEVNNTLMTGLQYSF